MSQIGSLEVRTSGRGGCLGVRLYWSEFQLTGLWQSCGGLAL